MSRQQVSIDRITPRRLSLQPRESMNCKSCRKRKIKCNRLRPSCEACQVFQCPCIYDAVPKKRGPKTDVLETLLKRVDGLEKRVRGENSSVSPTPPVKKPEEKSSLGDGRNSRRYTIDSSMSICRPTNPQSPSTSREGTSVSAQSSPPRDTVLPDAILDTYFARLHGKPFFILDEASTRQSHHVGQLPICLSIAIYALTVRYTSSGDTPDRSLRGLEDALQARRMVDVDCPSIEGLQVLLLLSQTFFAHNLGKKAYMTFASCVAMVIALDLLRELPSTANLSPAEKETRRRLFWSAYLMDRFITSGSKRPCLIPDHCIVLRLPSWSPHAAGLTVDGELFNNAGPNVQYSPDSRRRSQGAAALLIDITRILGITNRYLAAGGVKGDSHFPWHALSNLSKIRQELDIWATGTQGLFASVETMFGHAESTTLLLSKLIYHLVHCLIYRSFLPIDLVELRGTGQHQSWQIEATNLCFSHSNAIVELIELARNSSLIEWPSFVSFCVFTAGTVHVHGVHYKGREGEVFSTSAKFLTREMQQLSWLRSYWAGVQHQRQMLQAVYTCHAELVRTLASSPVRFSPVFHLEDFFDRYPGLTPDGAHVQLVDQPESGDSPAIHLVDRQDSYRQMDPPYLAGRLPRARSSLIPHTGQTLRRMSSPGLNFNRQSPQLSSIFPTPTNISPPPAASLEIEPTSSLSPSCSSFGFTPPPFLSESAINNISPTPPANLQYASFPFDSQAQPCGPGPAALTPGDQSSQVSSSHTTGGTGTGAESATSEKDPFLSVLEQLAENETSQGGPSELDFFLGVEAEGCLGGGVDRVID